MITREKLEGFRSSRRELAEIRAEIKKAELDGSGTRNGFTIAMYEAIAAERADDRNDRGCGRGGCVKMALYGTFLMIS